MKDLKGFILAGKAVFTVKNNNSGNYFTYKVVLSENKKEYYVSVLTGPNHKKDFRLIGKIQDDNFTPDHIPIIKAKNGKVFFTWFFPKLLNNSLPVCISVFHSGQCGKCGRKLTNPESIVTGIGPECIKKEKVEGPAKVSKRETIIRTIKTMPESSRILGKFEFIKVLSIIKQSNRVDLKLKYQNGETGINKELTIVFYGSGKFYIPSAPVSAFEAVQTFCKKVVEEYQEILKVKQAQNKKAQESNIVSLPAFSSQKEIGKVLHAGKNVEIIQGPFKIFIDHEFDYMYM